MASEDIVVDPLARFHELRPEGKAVNFSKGIQAKGFALGLAISGGGLGLRTKSSLIASKGQIGNPT